MTDFKSTIKNTLDWIESLDTDPVTHSDSIIQFNQEVKRLIQIGHEVVVPVQEKLLTTNNRYMVWAAAWILGEVGDSHSLDALWYAFKKYQSDRGLQHECILSICKLKDNNISDRLLEILRQRESSVVLAAIQGLGILQENRAIPDLVDVFLHGTQEEYSRCIPVSQSKCPGIHVKKAIIEALGKIQTDESIHELQNILYLDPVDFSEGQHIARLKCDVIVALAKSTNPTATTVISEALRHPIKGVRKMAKRYLDGRGHNMRS